MVRVATGKRALRRHLKEVQRELSAVRNDIRALEKGKPARRTPRSEDRRGVGPTSTEYPVPNLDPVKSEADAHVASLLDAQRKLPRPPVDENRLAQEDRVIKERAKNVRDERFSDYLASSFEAGGSLRYERKIQRNKAVLVVVVALALLVWVLIHLLG